MCDKASCSQASSPGEERKSQCGHMAPLSPTPLCTCPSSCCSLPLAPFTPKDKFPPSLVLSLFLIMLLSMCGFGGRVGAPLSSQTGGLLSSDLAGPCCLPCSLVTSLPSLSQGLEKASLYRRGHGQELGDGFPLNWLGGAGDGWDRLHNKRDSAFQKPRSDQSLWPNLGARSFLPKRLPEGKSCL